MVYIFHGIPAPYRFALFSSLNGLLKGGLEVCFLSSTAKNRRWQAPGNSSFSYKTYPSLKFGFGLHDWNEINFNWSLFKRLFTFTKSDTVIVSGWLDLTNQLAIFLACLIGYKVIIWSESTVNETSLLRTLTLPYVRLLIKLAHGYIAIGSNSKKYLLRLGADPSRLSVALSAVDNRLYQTSPSLNPPLHLKPGWQYALYVGQLIKRKNIATLLQAVAKLQPAHRLGLLIAGYGPLEQELKDLAKSLDLKECRFLGSQAPDDLPGIYKQASLLVLPSTVETWGLVVNEAMASGLPVVVSKNCGAAADLVVDGQNGHTFPPLNPGILADKILATLNNRRRYSEASLRLINRATPEKAAAAFYQLIKKI